MTTDEKNNSYAVLDTGEELKLERIGPYQVVRQATHAHWPKRLNEDMWREVAAVHHRSSTGGGQWAPKQTLPKTWPISCGDYKFLIKLTDFGHIGVFPEQQENWEWVRRHSAAVEAPRVLNLFGYTGGTTLAAARGGAQVTHVDASKGVVAWARENAAANQLADKPIRWITEDVSKYIQRETNRGSRYQGLVLDPPSFGRGPRGQLFKIEDHLLPLLRQLEKITDPLRFILLTCHSPGYSPECLKNLLHLVFSLPLDEMEAGEMSVPVGDSGMVLPSGTFARWAAK